MASATTYSALDEEHFHFQRVIGSFNSYEHMALVEAERTQRASLRLSSEYGALLPRTCLEQRVVGLRAAAAANGAFLRRVVASQGSFGPPPECNSTAATYSSQVRQSQQRSLPREADFSKVRSTLHSCVRDWADEGAIERTQCYSPLLEELVRLVPLDCRRRVLVPGAGLARLVLEVAARGYGAQGNEFSYHMLLASNYLLNSGLRPRGTTIYPFVDQPSNCRASQDRVRAVRIPDVSPNALLGPMPSDFSMAAGEFLEVYRHQECEWDALLSCFFLDTAPVALEYIDAMYRLLKPGAPWINLGPLLYHWVPSSSADIDVVVGTQGRLMPDLDDRYSQSLEFSWYELRHAIQERGFVIIREEWRRCTYTNNIRSMMKTDYDCIFFTALKPAHTTLSTTG
eukprot:CAMPEP_0119275636 /NCGR_PEP_ID=MMETSP1329-20130426/14095_1 /TAXON_ID=114041 /ORGANISM="Genus nov. species nov., Strain RCC1024" /LENGTH=398 /DNA_ID=CAMNT_0007276031 /DNA_START=76 /DNA_END=1272 /DNA_ORIENTATION=+